MRALIALTPFMGLALAAPAQTSVAMTTAATSGAKSSATAATTANDASGAIKFTAYAKAQCSGSAISTKTLAVGKCVDIGSAYTSFKYDGTTTEATLYVFEGAGCTGEQTQGAHSLTLNAANEKKCQETSDWYPTPLFGGKDPTGKSVQLVALDKEPSVGTA